MNRALCWLVLAARAVGRLRWRRCTENDERLSRNHIDLSRVVVSMIPMAA
jgi:hypothetical protein